MFIESARVLKESEQLHQMPVGTAQVSQHQAVGSNTSPTRDTVMAPPIDLKLLAQLLQKRLSIEDKHMRTTGFNQSYPTYLSMQMMGAVESPSRYKV